MKLKSIIGIVMVPVCVVLCCIGAACAVDEIPDYSAEVAEIVANTTMTSQEKLTAQTQLFGWDIRLELWSRAQKYDYDTMEPCEPIYSQETLGAAYWLVYQAGLSQNMWYGLEDGRNAYSRYCAVYEANYHSWDDE